MCTGVCPAYSPNSCGKGGLLIFLFNRIFRPQTDMDRVGCCCLGFDWFRLLQSSNDLNVTNIMATLLCIISLWFEILKHITYSALCKRQYALWRSWDQSIGLQYCGNRALSANDDTSEMIWGSDIKRERVERALRNGERGDCPLGDCSDRERGKEKKMLLC